MADPRASEPAVDPWASLRERRGWLLLLLLTVLGFLYGPVLGFEFVNYDDDVYVTRNPFVPLGLTWSGLMQAFSSTTAAHWHPVTMISHMVDVQIFGTWPGGHHASSLLVHAAATVLVYTLLANATGAPLRALVVAAVFALHPLRVESVAWVAERKDVLSGAFYLATLLFWMRFLRRGRTMDWWLTLLCMVLGMMAKAMLVTIPVVALLLDFWPLQRLTFGRETWWPRIREKWPLFVLAGLGAIMAPLSQKIGGAMVALDRFPLELRVANAIVSFIRYLVLTVAPLRLAFYHPIEAPPLWQVAGALALLIAVTGSAFWISSRAPYLLVGWLWYLVSILPVIGLMQVGPQGFAARYTYIPMLGPVVALVWLLADRFAASRVSIAVPIGLTSLALLPCIVLTRYQLGFWRDSETLMRRALEVTVNNDLAHNNLGEVLARRGLVEEAQQHYEAAARINPKSPIAQANLGVAALRRSDSAMAERSFRAALQLRPDLAEGHNGLGTVLASRGDVAGAAREFEAALRAKPAYPEAHANLGDARMRLDDAVSAARHYGEAVRREPGWWEVRARLGVALAMTGQLDAAIAELRMAVRQQPQLARLHLNLGLALADRGLRDEASSTLQRAIELARADQDEETVQIARDRIGRLDAKP